MTQANSAPFSAIGRWCSLASNLLLSNCIHLLVWVWSSSVGESATTGDFEHSTSFDHLLRKQLSLYHLPHWRVTLLTSVTVHWVPILSFLIQLSSVNSLIQEHVFLPLQQWYDIDFQSKTSWSEMEHLPWSGFQHLPSCVCSSFRWHSQSSATCLEGTKNNSVALMQPSLTLCPQ